MILIDTVYINQSGGKVLINYLIKSLHSLESKFANLFFLFDERFESDQLSLIPIEKFLKIRNSERERIKFYRAYKEKLDKIFCFGNIPPPIHINDVDTYIYFHNSLYLFNSKSNHNIKSKIIIGLKKKYIQFKNHPKYKWIVQTEYIKQNFILKMNTKASNVLVLPFFEVNSSVSTAGNNKNELNKYVYVADGSPQKNHLILLKAWKILFYKFKTALELHLTIHEKNSEIIVEIEKLKNEGLKIFNHGECSLIEINNLYKECGNLVFPSLNESFGLPLIEAAYSNCNIIASNLPFVFEIVVPSATFNPYDENDIAQSIYDFSTNETTETQIIVQNEISKLINLITTIDI
jgi:glycosyltransferase involved in cell wall biosynthesis